MGALLGELGRMEDARASLELAEQIARNAHERAQIRARLNELEAVARGTARALDGLRSSQDTARRELACGATGMTAEELFWQLAAELRADDPRVVEGTIMNGRCLRVGKEFLALVDYKGSGLVVKLPKARVDELIECGIGQPFAPAGRVFEEWLSVPKLDRRRWRSLLREGVAFVK
jgi:hypothetical protein